MSFELKRSPFWSFDLPIENTSTSHRIHQTQGVGMMFSSRLAAWSHKTSTQQPPTTTDNPRKKTRSMSVKKVFIFCLTVCLHCLQSSCVSSVFSLLSFISGQGFHFSVFLHTHTHMYNNVSATRRKLFCIGVAARNLLLLLLFLTLVFWGVLNTNVKT